MSIIWTNAVYVAGAAGGVVTALLMAMLLNGLVLYAILDDCGNEIPAAQCLNCADYIPPGSSGLPQ